MLVSHDTNVGSTILHQGLGWEFPKGKIGSWMFPLLALLVESFFPIAISADKLELVEETEDRTKLSTMDPKNKRILVKGLHNVIPFISIDGYEYLLMMFLNGEYNWYRTWAKNGCET